MKIHKKQVPDTAYQMLERLLSALPSVYKIEPFDWVSEDEPERFAIFLGSSDVATANFDGENFSFDFTAGSKGEHLERQLKQLYGDQILWIVLYPFHSAWSYFGEPKETADLAMEEIEDIAFKGGQPHLVAFRSSEWPAEMLKVQHSWTIYGNNKVGCRRGDADAGDMLYQLLTTEE